MKVRTLEPVEHDGKKIKPGSVIDIDDAAGRQLVDARAAEAIGKGKAAAAAPAPDAADEAAGGDAGEAEQGK